jgi:hypothetical protein
MPFSKEHFQKHKFTYEMLALVCFFLAMIGVYRYIVAQWLGDAQSISNKPDKEIDCQQSTSLASILLVKKLGKEFLIKTKTVEWVEAYGNYANLRCSQGKKYGCKEYAIC